MGDTVGRKVDGNQIDFSYISVRGSEKSTNESTENMSSPQTPRNSTRWKDWQTKGAADSVWEAKEDGDDWQEGSSPSRLWRVESSIDTT